MGWKDAPAVEQKPKWQDSPEEAQAKPADTKSADTKPAPTFPMGGKGAMAAQAAIRDTPKVESGYTPSSMPLLDVINAGGSQLVRGLPVIGSSLDQFGNNVDAAWASFWEGRPVTADERARISEAERKEFPGVAFAGDVAGNTLPFAAIAKTAQGAKLLGMIGPMWQRMLYGGTSGGLIAGADKLSEGGSLADAAWATGLGSAFGGAFPWIERGMTKVFMALMGRGTPKDIAVINKALERDGIDPAQLAQKMDELGPEAVLPDLGSNTLQVAQGIAAQPGRGRQVVADRLEQRQAATNSRIQNDVDATLGPAPVPSREAAEIRANQDALSPEYEQVFTNKALSPDFEFDPAIIGNTVDQAVSQAVGQSQRRLASVRDMLTDPATGHFTTDPNRVFAVRKELDAMIATETNANTKGQLEYLRRVIDEDLGAQVAGLKAVDAKYAELARQNEALTTGQQLLDSGRTAARPVEVDTMMQQGALPQGQMVGPSAVPFRLSQGNRAEIERIIGTTANDLNALKTALKGDGSWNRERLASLYGPDKADQLIAILERESKYQNTFTKVLENSQTAPREAGIAATSPYQMTQNPTLTGMATAIPRRVVNTAAKARSEAVNSRVAAALMERPTPALVDQLLTARALANRRSYLPPAGAATMITSQ